MKGRSRRLQGTESHACIIQGNNNIKQHRFAQEKWRMKFLSLQKNPKLSSNKGLAHVLPPLVETAKAISWPTDS